MMPSRKSTFLFLITSFSAASAWADSKSVSGRYLDVDGDPIDIVHEGSKVTLKPDASKHDLPPEAREVLGNLLLEGKISEKTGGAFDINAKYSQELRPNPHVKLQFKVDFDAEAHPHEQGLHMKTCEWRITMVIFSGGEIAGSENKTEKCVGMWKRVSRP